MPSTTTRRPAATCLELHPQARAATEVSTMTSESGRCGLIMDDVKGTAVHVRWRLNAKEAKRRRSDVGERRILGLPRSGPKQHSGHESRIDAMVTAPRLDIVGEHRAGNDALRPVPRRPVAGAVSDQQ